MASPSCGSCSGRRGSETYLVRATYTDVTGEGQSDRSRKDIRDIGFQYIQISKRIDSTLMGPVNPPKPGTLRVLGSGEVEA
jgi:hypothetical protein